MAANSDLIKEWQSILNSNGEVPQDVKDRLMLAMIGELYLRFQKLEKYIPWLEATKWAVITLGMSVAALLWGIFTHTIMIVTK
jgi:hypothetical protein